jgi:hypothetical protein
MENGFDPLRVSEGQVTVGLKAISAAQDEGGAPVTAHSPGGLTIQERSTIENTFTLKTFQRELQRALLRQTDR